MQFDTLEATIANSLRAGSPGAGNAVSTAALLSEMNLDKEIAAEEVEALAVSPSRGA